MYDNIFTIILTAASLLYSIASLLYIKLMARRIVSTLFEIAFLLGDLIFVGVWTVYTFQTISDYVKCDSALCCHNGWDELAIGRILRPFLASVVCFCYVVSFGCCLAMCVKLWRK
jgi:uncharacterized membrane protein